MTLLPRPSSDAAGRTGDHSDDLSLEDFYEHAPCGYLSVDADGTVTRANATFLEWTGYPADTMVGRTRLVSLLTVGGQIFYETHCIPLLLAGQGVEQVSLELRRADGTVMPVLFGARVHARGADARPSVIRVTMVDVAQRRLFEQELVERNDALTRSNEEYDTFAHAVAHDLQAPLRGIRLNTEFFLEDFLDADRGGSARDLETVLRLTDRMRLMLDGLLAYTQAGSGPWKPQAIDLPQAVDEVVELLGQRAEGARIETSGTSLTADPLALRQLLLNLLTNAIKYSEGPANIEVGTCSLADASLRSTPPTSIGTAPPEAVVLTVADQGIGIAPAQQQQVFNLFRQVDPAADGSGTGLALCQLICRRHGGDIWLSSTPGAGSTFFALTGR